MDYYTYLNKIIDDGIEAVKRDYANSVNKLEGAIAGFEACRNCTSEELVELWQISTGYVENAQKDNRAHDYWYFRTYQAEVEWVCNCISVLFVQAGLDPLLEGIPTGRAFLKYNTIIKDQNG